MASIVYEARLSQAAALIKYYTEMYTAGTPVVSDAEFDRIERDYLAKIGKSRRQAGTVGTKPSDNTGLKKIKHKIQMGSLEKANNRADIVNWIKTLSKSAGNNIWPLFWSVKLDGLSVDIRYENGVLILAVTRGDGTFGEDITRNVKIMQGVRDNIPKFTGDLRGEIIIKNSDFTAQNFPDASNTRNSAAGAAKSIHDNSKCRFCSVLFYRVIPYEESKVDEFNLLKAYRLNTPMHGIVNSVDEIMQVYHKFISETRSQLDCEIDGLVFEINDTETAFSVGTDMLHPEYAIALKFPNAEGETVLRDVIFQIGNTGRITPVAVFDEVILAGARITKASLATIGLLRSKQITIGARIIVSRRNDVIPMVERVVAVGTQAVKIPAHCPSCNHELTESGEYLICENTATCPAQLQGSIINYTKKLGILEWGDTVVEAICEAGLVDDVSDIYTLEVDQLESVTMPESGRVLGSKTAETMIRNLHNKNQLPLHSLIGSLGIKGIGRTMCKLLVDAGYDTVEKMHDADEYDLSDIQGFGAVRAREFVNGIKGLGNIIDNILVYVKISGPSTGKMKGKSVCMTGFRDAEMMSEIEAQGGTVKNSVGAGLTYLVQKERNSVSEKSKKATSLGTKVISIDDMWEILR